MFLYIAIYILEMLSLAELGLNVRWCPLTALPLQHPPVSPTLLFTLMLQSHKKKKKSIYILSYTNINMI